MKPPKTAGREQYGAAFIESLIGQQRLPRRSDRHSDGVHGSHDRTGVQRFAPATRGSDRGGRRHA